MSQIDKLFEKWLSHEGSETCNECKRAKQQFTQDIISLLREIVPEGAKASSSNLERYGYNKCRSEILEKIERMGK